MSEDIVYRPYVGESDLPHIMALVQSELSEPYVIYTYRYFLHQWPHLSFLAYPPATATATVQAVAPIGVIVCKQSMHRDAANRGYIAMLSVDRAWRQRGIGRTLVRRSVDAMKEHGVEEVVLETEFDNAAALSLYETLGFVREKRLYRFYMNGKDAFRLVLAMPHARIDSEGERRDSGVDGRGGVLGPGSGPGGAPWRQRALRVVPDWIAEFEDDEVSAR